jgi:cell division protein FtsB
MQRFFVKRRSWRTYIVPGICVAGLVYCAVDLIQAPRGLRTKAAVAEKMAAAKQELADLSHARAQIEHRVSLLASKTRPPDPDMLDERLRAMLNLVRPGEYVIMYDRPLDAPER